MSFKLLVALYTLLTIIYVILRSVYVPPIEDEVTTFFEYVRTGSFQPFFSTLDANNHVINSALSHLSFLIFGDGLFALRLPNVLALLLYLFYLFRFASFFKSRTVWFIWFLALTIPLYLISFFHLCRGYGLSITFLMGALYYLVKLTKRFNLLSLTIGLLMVSLSLWSNLALMTTILMISFLFALVIIRQEFWVKSIREQLTTAAVFIGLVILPIFYAALFSFELKSAGNIYHGAEDGFWTNCIIALALKFTDNWQVASILTPTIVVSYLVIFIYNVVNNKTDNGIYIHLTLIGSLTGTIVLHFLLQVNYPTDRAAVHFFPILITGWCLGIDASKQIWLRFLALIVLLVFTLNSLKQLNLSYTQHWMNESTPQQFYGYLLGWKEKNGKTPAVSAKSYTMGAMEYYDYLNEGQLNLITIPDFPVEYADFQIIDGHNFKNVSNSFDTIYYDHNTTLGLLQRKNLNWQEHLRVSVNSVETELAFTTLASIPAHQFNAGPCRIDVSFLVKSSADFKHWRLVFAIVSKGGEKATYEVKLERTFPKINGLRLIQSAFVVDSINPNMESIEVYVWNIHNKKISIVNPEVVVCNLPNL